jgi:hypothetical protein
MSEEEIDGLCIRSGFMAWDEECHLRKMIDYYPNCIMLVESGWKTTKKFHGNGFPWMRWDG